MLMNHLVSVVLEHHCCLTMMLSDTDVGALVLVVAAADAAVVVADIVVVEADCHRLQPRSCCRRLVWPVYRPESLILPFWKWIE